MHSEKKIVTILKFFIRHKKKIFFFILFFGLFASIYSYFQTNTYKATATIKIGSNHILRASENNLNTGFFQSQSNLNTETEVMQSRALISKALERIDLTHKYYVTKFFKEKELYRNSPFEVEMSKGEGLSFIIKPINGEYYSLKVQGNNKTSTALNNFNKICAYNKPVKEQYFNFTLFIKHGQTLEKDISYRFVVLSKRSAIDAIQKNLHISKSAENSSILYVNYKDNVAVRAMEFTNVLMELYLEKSAADKTLESTLILDFIDKQLEEIGSKLLDSEKDLEAFKKESNVSYIERKNAIAKGEKYKEELADLLDKEDILNKLYIQLEKGKNFTNISTAGLDLSSTRIPQLLTQLQNNLFKRKQLRIDYTMAHPAVRKLTASIEHTKQSIVKAVSTLKSRIQKRKTLLLKTIRDFNTLMKTLPAQEKVLGGLNHKLITNEKIYSYVMEKRASTAIAKASSVNKNSVINNAVEPLKPFYPNRILFTLIGSLIGLFIGLFSAFISEFVDDRIKNEEDIRQRSKLTLVGTIPHMSSKDDSIKVFESPKSVVSESFRALRTNLQFLHKKDGALLLSVTSTIGGEGKSTISSNLAAILSLTGKKIIILNLDMRKPTLHKIFSLSNNRGMSNILSGHSTLDEVIQETDHSGISIISSGPIPPNPSELIESNEMIETIDKLKENYDVIILDTPPIGLVTDAMTLMKISDITLFVLRANYSKKIFLEDIQRITREHELQGVSLLLNGIKAYKDGYGYYEEGK